MIRPFDTDLPLSRLPALTGDPGLDIQRLLDFVDQLYHPKVDQSFYIQLYVCIALVFMILVLASSVIGHRVLHGRAWFLKIWPVAGGTFVIPNSVMAFLNCQGCFAVIWIAYALISVKYYKNEGFQKSFFLWRVFVWVPLWNGGWWTGFGILSAFPDALTLKAQGGVHRRLILSPTIFNLACWAVPIVQLASIIPPAVFAARRYNASLDDYDMWRGTTLSLRNDAPSAATLDFVRAQAISLWLDTTRAYWFYGIAMTCWSIWAAICLAVYVPVGAHTLSRIRAQLKLARRKMSNPDTFYLFHPPFDRAANIDLVDQVKPERRVSIRTQDKTQIAKTSDSIHSHTSPTADSVQENPGLGIVQGSKTAEDEGKEDANHSVGPRNTTGSASVGRVFPPMRPRTHSPRLKHDAPMTVEERRIHNLERVYRNLSIQYYGICLAILCFFASSTVLASDGYDSARRNDVAAPQVSANLLAAYVMVLFGLLTIFCIFWRSFDPSLSIDIADEGSPPIPTRSKLVALKNRAFSVGSGKNARADPVEPSPSIEDVEGGMPDREQSRSSVFLRSLRSTGSQSSHVHQPFDAAASDRGSGGKSKLARKPKSSTSVGSPIQSGSVSHHEASTSVDSHHQSPSLFYVTPYGKVPAATGAGATSPKSSSGRDVDWPRHKSNLLAEHGSTYKPVASSFGQWRQAQLPQPLSSNTPASAFGTPGSVAESFDLPASNEISEGRVLHSRSKHQQPSGSVSSDSCSSEHAEMARQLSQSSSQASPPPSSASTDPASTSAMFKKRSGSNFRQTIAQKLVIVMDEHDRDIAALEDSRVNFV